VKKENTVSGRAAMRRSTVTTSLVMRPGAPA
jgi:hypothetical protein